MFGKTKIYTAESVTSGHPDKVCDQISDAILDECLRGDSKSRVAVENFGGHGVLNIGGEVTTKSQVDFEEIARQVYRDIGYEEDLEIISNIACQSSDIAQGVDTGGAGDQGIMYGYATDETDEYLPKGLVLAHKLAEGLEKLRKDGGVAWLLPDGKSQVTMEDDNVRSVLISTQHKEDISQEEIREILIQRIIINLISGEDIDIYINPTGKFVQGGFEADTGLTGRKIMVDTYGGLAPHGGGAFSGKDPSKVDRSAAYMARFVAKNIVANKLAKKCMVSAAYAIGRAEPLMVEALDENGNSLASFVNERFDFRPKAIIERLDLQKPIYRQTACYGHFGKQGLPWEAIEDLA